MSTPSPNFDPFAFGEIGASTASTQPQREIWAAVALGGAEANLAYNESVCVRLSGPLEKDLAQQLEGALLELVGRHDALRATFSEDGLTLYTSVQPQLELTQVDLRALPEPQAAKRLRELHDGAVREPFDLMRGPLIRATLVWLDAQRAELLLTAHHIICDGYSFGILLGELEECWRARSEGRPTKLSPAPSFVEFAIEQQRARFGEAADEAEHFWLRALGKSPEVLDLPTDRPRSLERPLAATRLDVSLPAELCTQVRAKARSSGVSLTCWMLATWNVLLYRLTLQETFLVGMPAAGQAHSGSTKLVGHCVNTLPLPVQLNPKAPFSTHLDAMKRVLLDCAEQQQLALGELLPKLEVVRDPSRVPLIPVLFNLDQRLPSSRVGEVSTAVVALPRVFEHFEIFLNVVQEQGDGLAIEATYNDALFDSGTMQRWMSQYVALLASASADTSIPLSKLRAAAPNEALLLDAWNATAVQLPTSGVVLDDFERIVEQHPNKPALRFRGELLSYAETNGRANALAHELRAQGVHDGEAVGLFLERSQHLVVAMLATWKVGACYVPLDPEYPSDRLRFVVEDAGVSVVVREATGPSLPFTGVREVNVGGSTRPDAPPRDLHPSSRAYVLHTSGSTGKPKGVVVEHGNVCNLLHGMAKELGFAERDVLLAVTTPCFDISVLELFLPLTQGAELVVAPRDVVVDANALSSALSVSAATWFQATPATYRMLLEAGFGGSASLGFLCGGEALSRDLAHALLPRCRTLYNVYGPTETTIWSTLDRVETSDRGVAIGRPVANTHVYVVDENGELAPLGCAGELYIGGAGVAQGYLNRPELTNERFVPDRFSASGGKLYRTGDIVRWGADGKLYYERRADAQVKVRGFRIELGEIEASLLEHGEVAQAACIVRRFDDTDVRILAYVVPSSAAATPEGLAEHLASRLPPYMLPQAISLLAALPRTENGKLDARRLPIPLVSAEVAVDEPPLGDVESALAEVWAGLLRVPRVGARDNFFRLGGHSMLAIRMLTMVRDRFDVELPLRYVFQAPTLSSLAERIEAAQLLAQPTASDQDREAIEF